MRDAAHHQKALCRMYRFNGADSHPLAGQAGIEPATLRLLAAALPTELLSHDAGFSPARIPGAVVAHIRHGPSMIPEVYRGVRHAPLVE